MNYPIELHGPDIPPHIERLVRDLGDRLLAGHTQAHAALREQLAVARLSRVTLTGVGLVADFDVPATAKPISPADMTGGEALVSVRGLDAPAGSLVRVKAGRLAFIEVYTYGTLPWPDFPDVVSFGEASPLPIRE
jgi:hypothetical protein